MFNQYRPSFNKFSPNNKGRGNFRVKGPIKSFRDLEVYSKTTALSADIFTLRVPEGSELEEEMALLKNISKHIPKMIAESYGNRFDNFSLAERKLEKTAEIISSVISKIDFILSVLKKEQSEDLEKEKENEKKDNELNEDFNAKINQLLKDYTAVRMKVLNLKRSWVRLNEKFGNK